MKNVTLQILNIIDEAYGNKLSPEQIGIIRGKISKVVCEKHVFTKNVTIMQAIEALENLKFKGDKIMTNKLMVIKSSTPIKIFNGNGLEDILEKIEKQAVPNANLVAAAPELLEALEGVMRFVQTKGEPFLPRTEAIEKAIEIINKAKGEE